MNCGIDHTGIHNQLSQRWLEADKGCFLSPAPPQNDHASFYFCQSSVFLVQDETPSLSFWRFINSRGRHGIAPFLPLWQRNKNIGVEFKWLNVDGTSVWCFLLETRKTDLLRTQKIGLGAKNPAFIPPLLKYQTRMNNFHSLATVLWSRTFSEIRLKSATEPVTSCVSGFKRCCSFTLFRQRLKGICKTEASNTSPEDLLRFKAASGGQIVGSTAFVFGAQWIERSSLTAPFKPFIQLFSLLLWTVVFGPAVPSRVSVPTPPHESFTYWGPPSVLTWNVWIHQVT